MSLGMRLTIESPKAYFTHHWIHAFTRLLTAIAIFYVGGSSPSQAEGSLPSVTFVQSTLTQSIPISQGSTNYLDSEGAAFVIAVMPHNFGCKDKLTGVLVTSFTDKGKGGGSLETHYFSFTGAAGTEIYLNYGGSAQISYHINDADSVTFTFNVRGNNPPASFVDEYATSGASPWFFPLILGQESAYQQFASGLPKIGSPDGIGIAQIDATANSVNGFDYWEASNNILDGFYIENGKKSTAYNFFQNQLNQAGSSNPPPVSQALRSCTFAQSPNNLTSRPWGDADWIHVYNGTGTVYGTCPATGSQVLYTAGYYISWTLPANGIKGYWRINTTQGGPSDCFNGRSYVGDVCSQPYR